MSESTHAEPLVSPSIMSHVSVGSNRLPEALAFYDQVLLTIGARRVIDIEGVAVAYGKEFPEFWVQLPHNLKSAETANGVHFAFLAQTPTVVDAFYAAAMKAGATDDGAPGPRPMYSDAYYGCFVRDLDGHKIEAMYWDASKAPSESNT
ncbi:VOC family protein [Echinimonas agarilytica]|uniref:VOC family protein n=1 Tax=Echinimonas agarilytica TaxID=1215918 RepID=A0AA41W857_9GAMM|nr:VOC family protein [Echinimonas agarilytica]MCM2680193.1 VOC family protein [Echinimonas agarilytica]